MGRQKKNELDAILEQLKRSYAADMNDDQDDPLSKDERIPEDEELSSVLEKIFAEADKKEEAFESGELKSAESEAVVDEADKSESPVTDIRENEESMLANDTDGSNKDTYSEEQIESSDDSVVSENGVFPAPVEYYVDGVKNSAEEDRVDDVLKAMLHKNELLECDISTIDDNSEKNEIINQGDGKALAITEFKGDIEESIETIEKSIDDSIKTLGDGIEEIQEEAVGSFEEGENDPSDDVGVITSSPPHIVLSADAYTYDPLQQSLADMNLYKPHSSILFEDKKPMQEQQEGDRAAQNSVEERISDERDISLLLKLGYSEEASSSVGESQTREFLLKQEHDALPASNKVIHGFTGREFSEDGQIQGIKKKYKRDKVFLSIRTLIISALALVCFMSDVLLSISPVKINYIPLTLFELTVILVISIFLCRKLFLGFLGIIRFEADSYSVLSIIVSQYILYGVISFAVYIFTPELIGADNMYLFGGIVLIYIALVSVCELIDCNRESDIFDMMTDGKTHYTLEKQYDGFELKSMLGRLRVNKSRTIKNSYRISETKWLSSYFKNTSAAEHRRINIVYILGIIPIIAVIVGGLVAILDEKVMSGINTVMMISCSALPFSYLFAHPILEFLQYVWLKSKRIAFVGGDSVQIYSKTESITFRDRDAVEITSYTEINPSKISDTKKWLNLSFKVFEALGGTLSHIVPKKDTDISNIDHEVAINSISENGIDIFFDSSMNVLIGDRAYMQSHNIKVRTDISLTTAIKGPDKSVIYIAFDGIPQLAFIINCKLKASFLEIVSLLDANDILSFVKSYEPHINDMYFEQNKGQLEINIPVGTSAVYERTECRKINEGAIIAEDPKDLARAVVRSREMLEDRKKISRINLWLRILGIIISSVLCLFKGIAVSNEIITLLKSNIIIIFYLIMLFGMIPGLVSSIIAWKKKNLKARTEHKK